MKGKIKKIILSFLFIAIILATGTVFGIMGENKAIDNSPYFTKLLTVSNAYSVAPGQEYCTIKMKDGKPTPCCDDGNHVACTFDSDCVGME